MSDVRQMKLLLSVKKQIEQEKASKWAELETAYAERLVLANNNHELRLKREVAQFLKGLHTDRAQKTEARIAVLELIEEERCVERVKQC
jgi:menaquinone-dependent protoporphyrinogen IX oxidase